MCTCRRIQSAGAVLCYGVGYDLTRSSLGASLTRVSLSRSRGVTLEMCQLNRVGGNAASVAGPSELMGV